MLKILNSLHAGKVFVIFHDFNLLLFLFKVNTFEQFFHEYHQCQTVSIKMKPGFQFSQNWVQTVCKSYQQTTLAGIGKV